MNPYTNSVINATLPLMQQQNALSQNQQADAAASAKAFGGSKQGAFSKASRNRKESQHRRDGGAVEQRELRPGVRRRPTTSIAPSPPTPRISRPTRRRSIPTSWRRKWPDQHWPADERLERRQFQHAAGRKGHRKDMQQQNQINAQMAKFNQAFNYPQQQLGVLESSLGMTPHDTSTSANAEHQHRPGPTGRASSARERVQRRTSMAWRRTSR